MRAIAKEKEMAVKEGREGERFFPQVFFWYLWGLCLKTYIHIHISIHDQILFSLSLFFFTSSKNNLVFNLNPLQINYCHLLKAKFFFWEGGVKCRNNYIVELSPKIFFWFFWESVWIFKFQKKGQENKYIWGFFLLLKWKEKWNQSPYLGSFFHFFFILFR